MGQNGVPEPPSPTVGTSFVSMAKAKIGKEKGLSAALNVYLTKSADVAKKTTDDIMIGAVPFFEDFWKQFLSWNAIENKKEGIKTGKETKQDAPGSTNGGNGGDSTAQEDKRPRETEIVCPAVPGGETRILGFCRENCMSAIDCSAWK